jgi:signal transduction histidine kinase
MKSYGNASFVRLIFVSLGSALFLCLISIFCLARLADSAAQVHREHFLYSLADSIESGVPDLSNHGPLPPDLPPMDFPPPPSPHHPPHHLHPRHSPPPPFASYWLLNGAGDVLYSNNSRALPLNKTAWARIPKPGEPHQIVAKQDFLRLSGGLFVLKLNHEPALYLLIKEERPPFRGPLFWAQAALTFGAVLTALLLSLSMTFYYLRRKSLQAREVLLRLEKGDLNARFQIRRFDEFGGLLLDFNRMADEIERLVGRLRESETLRKNLLQELGHDLRTPLTSLQTSFENLRFHRAKMSESERQESFEMIAAEVDYFKNLLEKLMLIATFDEVHYKKTTELISLRDLLTQEIRTRQNVSPLRWEFHVSESANSSSGLILGDSNLILRMIKNAFDNAARYARTTIALSLETKGANAELRIVDDGPGLSDEQLKHFAHRREQRSFQRGERLDISLGLGSVIMKSIAELHGGSLRIKNKSGEKGLEGAELEITLPLAPAAHRARGNV